MAKYSATQIEQRFEAYYTFMDDLDSLKRSETFFEKEFKGENRKEYLSQVNARIMQKESLIAGLSVPKSIGQLQRENGAFTQTTLALMVNDLRKYFILDRMITNEGIKSLCSMLVITYPSMKLEELAVCFCNAKKGLYGEDFQRMDGSTIMRWLRIYNEDKRERLANKEYAKEVQYKAGADHGRFDPGPDNQVQLQKAISLREIELSKKKL